MKNLLIAAAVLALSAGASLAEPLRMGTEGAYPPYNFVNEKGEVDGFEIELGNELCKRIQAECTWVRNDWDSIIPNLVSGNYDTIMAGMNITDERRKSIAFSDAYTPPPPSAYVALAADADVTGIVAAQINTIQAGYVAESGATLVEFATGEEAIAAVRNGEADAVFADKDFLAPFMKDSNGELVWVTGQDNVSLGEGIGIGMRQSDTELKARFDEEANINWAERLEQAGAQVVYGVVGYKTHAKMLLIVRREGRKLKRYVHLGTGNYHSGTARLYTDLSLITADVEIGNDVHMLFQQLSGLAPRMKLEQLLQSPFTLHTGVLQRIERETRLARNGRPGRIIAKMNALNEPQVVRALYTASQAGVQIDLIVRGACTLRPGVPGVSDNIRVRSIVGRFLEHSRVYWFGNDGAAELYCASADWLERNLLRRVEVAFPVRAPALKKRVLREGLHPYLKDNVNAWELGSDGHYRRRKPRAGQAPCSAQQVLMDMLGAAAPGEPDKESRHGTDPVAPRRSRTRRT